MRELAPLLLPLRVGAPRGGGGSREAHQCQHKASEPELSQADPSVAVT